MTTYLQLVNKVLIRLREETVLSVAQSPYALLIGEFVQQALSEVENATDWIQLRTTIQVPTTAGNFSYTLTGAGESFNILGVHEDTEDYDLRRAPSYNWMNHQLLNNDVNAGHPLWYDVNGQDQNGDPVVNFYPVPDGVYNVNFNMKIKSVFSADGDTSPVPELPVVLRAVVLAVDERGDDQGASLNVLETAFANALSDAIAYDRTNYPDENIWEVV